MAIHITQFPKAPQLVDTRVDESMLHDKEVNFVLIGSHPVDPPACTERLPAATARTTNRSSAATSFKTTVKSSLGSHGSRKFRSRRMAHTRDSFASVPEEGMGPIGYSMENGHGGRCNLRDAELFKCENSIGNFLKNSDSTEGQHSIDHALSQSEPMQPWGRYTRCKTCHQRWKWNEGQNEWKLDGFSSKRSQQLPVPWTPTDGHLEQPSISYPIAAAPQQSYAAPPLPKQLPIQPQQPKRRSRPPSMTSSAAGHGTLTAEALQDFDAMMDQSEQVIASRFEVFQMDRESD